LHVAANYNNLLITVLFKLTVSTVQTTGLGKCCVYLHKTHTQFSNSATYLHAKIVIVTTCCTFRI